jgi:hypothetical protein
MASNRLGSRTRLPGLYHWCGSLLFACGLFSFVPGCNSGPHRVDLTWGAPSKSPVQIVGYNIYRSSDGDSSYHLLNSSPVKETKYVDTLIQSGRTYHYIVRSIDFRGVESSPSNMSTVTVPK